MNHWALSLSSVLLFAVPSLGASYTIQAFTPLTQPPLETGQINPILYGLIQLPPWKEGYTSTGGVINQNGLIACDAWIPAPPYPSYPALFDHGVVRPLPLSNFAYGEITCGNNLGEVAGDVQENSNGDSPVHAVYWGTDGSLHDLGTLGGSQAMVVGINDHGQMAINSDAMGGLLWDNGQVTPISDATHSPGGVSGINNLGHILGGSNDVPFLWHDGVFTDIGVLPAYAGTDSGTSAIAFNDQDQVTGYSWCAVDGRREQTAILWQDGVLYDLNTLIPADSGWVLYDGVAIGQDGSIFGYGLYDGTPGSYLLTPTDGNPVPEPSSLVLLALGAGVLLRRCR